MLKDGDLATLLPWIKQIGESYEDCKVKQAYLSNWVQIAREKTLLIEE